MMHKEPFVKKAEKSFDSRAIFETEERPKHGLQPRPNIHPCLNTFTPQKQREQQQEAHELSNYSECDRLMLRPRSKNLSLAENISHFLQTQSSGKSDLSFQSDAEYDRYNSSSTRYEKDSKNSKDSKAPSLMYPALSAELKVFLHPQRFKPEFVEVCQEQLRVRCSTLELGDHWGLDKLFVLLPGLGLTHPFADRELADWKGLQTLQSLMDRWIFDREQHKNLVFSFDLCCSHISLVLVLVFYWMQLQPPPTPNPLLSRKEQSLIERQRYSTLSNLLEILHSYIVHRSREYRSNMVVIKLLNEFYDFAKECLKKGGDRDHKLLDLCRRSHEKLSDQLRYEMAIVGKLQDGKDCDPTHLRQIYKNYEEKDKFIRDEVLDIADVFGQLSKRAFVNCPLSRFYQTGEEDIKKEEIGERFTTISCWLMTLVLKKTRNAWNQGWGAIDYLVRYVELSRVFFQRRDLENLVLFGSVLLNIRQDLPSVWSKLKERKNYESLETELDNILTRADNMTFNRTETKELVVHSFIKILKIIDTQKQRFLEKDKGLVNLNFHQIIQQCARKIMHFRNMIETKTMQFPSVNKTIKINLNYRFLYHEIYTILKEEKRVGHKQYQRFREEAKKANTEVCFPFHYFYYF